MQLYLDTLLDANDEGTDNIAVLLHYIRESDAMRKVYVGVGPGASLQKKPPEQLSLRLQRTHASKN